jgi:hypothetical protein
MYRTAVGGCDIRRKIRAKVQAAIVYPEGVSFREGLASLESLHDVEVALPGERTNEIVMETDRRAQVGEAGSDALEKWILQRGKRLVGKFEDRKADAACKLGPG